jgi:ATP-dependent Clp protease ATP-binding subunit ClpC
MEIELRTKLDFTPAALQALGLAEELRRRRGHKQIGTEHLALALAAGDDTLGAAALRGLGVKYDALEAEIEKLVSTN